MLHRRRSIGSVIIMVALLQSCALRSGLPNQPDLDIERVVQTLDVTVNGLTVFQKTVIASNTSTPKLINDQTADQLARFAVEMNNAAKQAIAATRAVSQLSPEDRANISKILTPIMTAVTNTLNSPGLAGIQSEQLRTTIQLSLTSIQTTVSSVQLILAARR